MSNVYILIESEERNIDTYNTLICKIVPKESCSVDVIETTIKTIKTNGIVIEEHRREEIRTPDGIADGTIFSSKEELKKYLLSEYEVIKTTKHTILMLYKETHNKVVGITNYKGRGFEVSDDFLNLQNLLGL